MVAQLREEGILLWLLCKSAVSIGFLLFISRCLSSSEKEEEEEDDGEEEEDEVGGGERLLDTNCINDFFLAFNSSAVQSENSLIDKL